MRQEHPYSLANANTKEQRGQSIRRWRVLIELIEQGDKDGAELYGRSMYRAIKPILVEAARKIWEADPD